MKQIISRIAMALIATFICMQMSFCGLTNKVDDKRVFVDDTGITAIGIGYSQSEKIAISVAQRDARYALVHYLNNALAEIDKNFGISEGTHKIEVLEKTKIVSEDIIYLRRGNIKALSKIGLCAEDLESMLESFYETLGINDELRQLYTANQLRNEILSGN